MIVYLLSREFNLMKHDEDDSVQGDITYRSQRIRLNPRTAIDPVQVILHELAHAYVYFTGLNGAALDGEPLVDFMSNWANQMIIENGPDIFYRIERWTESK